jgi:hypothetical protein
LKRRAIRRQSQTISRDKTNLIIRGAAPIQATSLFVFGKREGLIIPTVTQESLSGNKRILSDFLSAREKQLGISQVEHRSDPIYRRRTNLSKLKAFRFETAREGEKAHVNENVLLLRI